jgi:hypothetical protein
MESVSTLTFCIELRVLTIRSIDAHTEGDGGAYDLDLFLTPELVYPFLFALEKKHSACCVHLGGHVASDIF